MNKNKDYKKEVLEDAILVSFLAEKHKRTWLKLEAKKRKMSLGALLRYYIDYFRNK